MRSAIRANTRGAAIGRPRLRLAIERGRPPVEQQQPVARRRAATTGSSAVSNSSAAAPNDLAEIQRLAEADEQVDLVARRQRGGADGRQRLARRRQVGRVDALAVALEVGAGDDQRRGVGPLRLLPRRGGGVDGAVVVAGVVERARPGQRRRLGRARGRGAADAAPARAQSSREAHAHRTHTAPACVDRVRTIRLLQCAPMGEPVIVPRAEHTISRQQIDPDALKVLYRLHQNDYVAYLVGGSVRDLLLGRRPKDFDIGTSAHPYQVKRLFRNCWIIGRRFRLAHVRFGTEDDRGGDVPAAGVGRRSWPPPRTQPAERRSAAETEAEPTTRATGWSTATTPSARRRKTRSAATSPSTRCSTTSRTFSIIDYTGGLEDLRAGVRALHRRPGRAVPGGSGAHAARRGDGGAARLHHRSADRRGDRRPSRRDRAQRAGAADRGVLQAAALGRVGAAFRMLAERRLLEPIAPELQERRRRARSGSRWRRSTPTARASRRRPTR